MITWPAKSSTEVEDFAFEWLGSLDTGETILTKAFVAAGVTIVSSAIAGSQVRVWLSGGLDGTVATVTATITTSGGRTFVETAVLPIGQNVVSLQQAKDYLRVRDSEEDAKIAAMIPRARLWVEDYTGLALSQRKFVEQRTPRFGVIHLFKGPLVSVTSIAYTDANGGLQTYTGTIVRPPLSLIAPATAWPVLPANEQFAVTYVAGYAPGFVDDRLIGAILALVEGEFSSGSAYPDGAVETAKRCCGFLRAMVA